MDDNFKKIKKLTAFMRKQGILSLKAEGIELTLAPAAIDIPTTADLTPESPKIEDQYTQEDALFWSAPGLPGNNDGANH